MTRHRRRARIACVVGDARPSSARAARASRASRWIAGAPPAGAVRARVRVRYRHAGRGGAHRGRPRDGGARVVRFDDAGAAPSRRARRRSSTTGDAVLGGGWIAGALTEVRVTDERGDADEAQARSRSALGHRFARSGAAATPRSPIRPTPTSTTAAAATSGSSSSATPCSASPSPRLLFETHAGLERGRPDARARRAGEPRAPSPSVRARSGSEPHARLGRTERERGGAEKESHPRQLLRGGRRRRSISTAGSRRSSRSCERCFGDALAAGDAVHARGSEDALPGVGAREPRRTPSYRAVRDSGVENDEQRFTVEVRARRRGVGARRRGAPSARPSAPRPRQAPRARGERGVSALSAAITAPGVVGAARPPERRQVDAAEPPARREARDRHAASRRRRGAASSASDGPAAQILLPRHARASTRAPGRSTRAMNALVDEVARRLRRRAAARRSRVRRRRRPRGARSRGSPRGARRSSASPPSAIGRARRARPGRREAARRAALALRISARSGEGIDALLDAVVARLPVGPAPLPGGRAHAIGRCASCAPSSCARRPSRAGRRSCPTASPSRSWSSTNRDRI